LKVKVLSCDLLTLTSG